MKKVLYKTAILLLMVIPNIGLAATDKPRGKYTKEKTIKQEYNVNSTALLKVSNSYGNLNITSWNEDRVLIEVHIKTSGNNEDKVQQKLDEITIDFDASSDMVSARTILGKNKSRWGWNWGKNTKVNMQINYTIKLPVKNSVSLNNNYGNIVLDRIDGHAKINCDYGRMDIGELRGRNNQLNFDYTSKSRIGYINSGKINADYSGFTVEKANDLEINADYTATVVNQMKNLDYSCDYGSVEIGEANNVDGNGDYVNVKLGTLHGNVDLVADYGSVRINKLASDAGSVSLRTEYTGIKLGYDPNYYFDFEITTEYAGVKGKDNFEINISKEKSSEKYYKGYYGKENSGNTVNITSDYGSIAFYQN